MIHANESNCTGCEACVSICPKKCIVLQENEHGFRIPTVNTEICIDCRVCEDVCPIQHHEISHKNHSYPLEAYAAINNDNDIRFNSTSGGVFSALAEEIMSESGYVSGAIYDQNREVVHILSNSIEDIKRLRQSKYTQSFKNGIYSDVENALKNGNRVLFVGTPCEVAALQNYLIKRKIEQARLITVDFLCLGANSNKVYREYLKYLELKYKSKVKKVWFKNKEKSWNRFSTRVDFENGKHYIADRYMDPYMQSYIGKPMIIRKCCEECLYKSLPHCSDITLADFWGVEEVIKGIDSNHGVSLVYINTETGKALFDSICDRITKYSVDIELTFKKNPMSQKSVILNKDREQFFSILSTKGFDEAIKSTLPNGIVHSIRHKIHVLRKHVLKR